MADMEDFGRPSPNTMVGTGADGAPVVVRRDGSAGPVNKLRGFVDYERQPYQYRPASERIGDWEPVLASATLTDPMHINVQAARCMNCGTPTCQNTSGVPSQDTNYTGCPLANDIPRFNAIVHEAKMALKGGNQAKHDASMRSALDVLSETSNAPEWTSHVCPAPCEHACVAGLVDDAVTIKSIEQTIVETGWENGWIVPRPPAIRSGRTVAVIGSGPAGLCAADLLNRAGHKVTVYERADRIGGLLVYGIPNMKLDKEVVQKRVDLWAAEGIEFITNAHVGVDGHHSPKELQRNHDALVLTVGSTKPRMLNVPGAELKGIYPAMDFLTASTKSILADDGSGRLRRKWDGSTISARGKCVVVIGGGDTGCDCIGTSVRQHARSVVNLELLPKPPLDRDETMPWPTFKRIYKQDYGHEEVQALTGADPRIYSVMTKEFLGDESGNVCGIRTVRVQRTDQGKFEEIPNSERVIPADLVLLSLGFVSPEETLLKQLYLKADNRGNISADSSYATSAPGIFAAGDCRIGQSLVVKAMREGRNLAAKVDKYLATKAAAQL